jgi:hypothetical protein
MIEDRSDTIWVTSGWRLNELNGCPLEALPETALRGARELTAPR